MSRLLDLAEAAERINMSRSWLRQQVTAQLVPCTRFGREVRFTEDQIAEIIAAHAQPVAGRLSLVRLAQSPRPSSPPPQPPRPSGPTPPPKATSAKARTA